MEATQGHIGELHYGVKSPQAEDGNGEGYMVVMSHEHYLYPPASHLILIAIHGAGIYISALKGCV
jgi:hypothetical protein